MKHILNLSFWTIFAFTLVSCGGTGSSTNPSTDGQEIAASQQADNSPQTNTKQKPTPENPGVPDTNPMYPGCDHKLPNEQKACSQRKMISALQKVIKYPAKAKDENVKGIVVHSFVIEADGTMSNLTLEKSLTPECDAAAYHAIVALMQESGPLTPGTLDGKNMAVRYTLPIQFGAN